MALSTYAELVTSVGDWLDRSDLTSQIPDFIALAEADISRKLRIREMVKRVTASVSTEYSDLPTDFIEARNIQVNATPTKNLTYMTPEQIDYKFNSSDTGEPVAFTIIGSELQIAPNPDATYTIEIAYFARFVALATASTNWLLTNHPGVYLYGSLAAAEPYLENDSRMQTWVTLYNNELDSLNNQDERARHSGSALATRPDFHTP